MLVSVNSTTVSSIVLRIEIVGESATASTFKLILLSVVAVPSLTSKVNATAPLKFCEGVTVNVPSPLSTTDAPAPFT